MSFLVVYQKYFNITFYSFISIKLVFRFLLFAVLVILFSYYFILLNINLIFYSFRWSRSGAFLCLIFLSFIGTLLFMLPVFISTFYSFAVITL